MSVTCFAVMPVANSSDGTVCVELNDTFDGEVAQTKRAAPKLASRESTTPPEVKR
jgi:hypothetical protein